MNKQVKHKIVFDNEDYVVRIDDNHGIEVAYFIDNHYVEDITLTPEIFTSDKIDKIKEIIFGGICNE